MVLHSIVGLLSTRIVKHSEKLSAGSYILCKDKISFENTKRAYDLLIQFADEFEAIYGKGAITMNIHLLKHYHVMIQHCGPLWAYSLFGFENNIGMLKKSVKGTTDYLEQISKNYAATKTQFNERVEPNRDTEFRNKSFIETKNLTVWNKLIMDGVTYTSVRLKSTKSIDYFVITKDNQIGKIQYYFYQATNKVFLLHVHKETFKNYHWSEIKSTD